MKKVWKKTIAAMLVLILTVGMLAGCGGGPVENEEEDSANYHVKLYYVSAEYLETGDESIEPMVVVDTDVAVPLEEADEIYETTLELLVQVSEEGMDTMIREGMVDDVTVTGGLAVVDLNEDTMHGGSMEEVYLIEQMVRTLIKSFDEVQKVRFTVEGGLITVQEDGADVELVSIMEE